MPHFEQTLSSETLFEGRVIRVTLDKVRLENGRTSTREVVHHHGGAGIAALDENGNIYLVRQYRYAPDQELIEIPAGKLEPGEDPLEAARRELGEEAGLCAAQWHSLGLSFPPAATAARLFTFMPPPGYPLWASIWMKTNFSACSPCRWKQRAAWCFRAKLQTEKPWPPC